MGHNARDDAGPHPAQNDIADKRGARVKARPIVGGEAEGTKPRASELTRDGRAHPTELDEETMSVPTCMVERVAQEAS